MEFMGGYMRIKPAVISIFLFLSFVWVPPGVSAQYEVPWKVLDDHAYLSFPLSIRFTITIDSTDEIQEITLFYKTNAQNCHARVARQKIDFDPAKTVYAYWEWDYQKLSAIPPGSQVTWSWEIKSKSGEVGTTPEQTLNIEDTSHTWKRVQREGFLLKWYAGDASFGNQMAEIVEDSLVRLKDHIGVVPGMPVKVMIYATQEELMPAALHAPEWIGGVAFPEYGVVLMVIPPGELNWAKEIIPHELTHIVVDQRIVNCVGYQLPTWLNEGLATYMEGKARSEDLRVLDQALKKDELEPLLDLVDGFSSDGFKAGMAYIQSRQVVAFLLETFETRRMDALLDLVQAGVPFETALIETYGYDTATLDNAWKAAYKGSDLPGFVTATPTPEKKHKSVPTMALWTSSVRTPTEVPPTITPIPSQTPSPTFTPTPASIVTRIATNSQLWIWGGVAVMVCAASLTGVIIIRKKKRG